MQTISSVAFVTRNCRETRRGERMAGR